MSEERGLFLKVFGFLSILFLVACTTSSKKNGEVEKIEKSIYLFQANLNNKVEDVHSAYLYKFIGDQCIALDSIRIDSNNYFQFTLLKEKGAGLYRIAFSSESFSNRYDFFDFIFNYEDVHLDLDYNYLNDSIIVISSEENKIWFTYQNITKHVLKKYTYLSKIMQRYYTPKDIFYKDAETEKNRIRSSYKTTIKNILDKNQGTLAVRYIKALLNTDECLLNITEYDKSRLKKNWFNNVDFTDTLLMYSDILPQKTAIYFSFYKEVDASKNLIESSLLPPIDTLMKLASKDKTIYDFVVRGLLNTFESAGAYNLFSYVMDKYFDPEICVNGDAKNKFTEDYSQIKQLVPGNKALSFQISSYDLKEVIYLDKVKAQYKLVLFWSISCSHCDRELRKLKELYSDRSILPFEVIAISVDVNLLDLKRAIVLNGYNWINCCDYKGWNGAVVKAYRIKGTPTMYLLDSENKIINRFYSVDELKKTLQGLLNK